MNFTSIPARERCMAHASMSRFICMALASASFAFWGTQGLSQDVAREDTIIFEVQPSGTTFRNYNNLNPFGVGGDNRTHIAYMYEPLFYWSALSGEHIPFLATGYEYNDDFTEVTVSLREGVTWSDGVPFTADDVVYTFEMLRENGEGSADLIRATDVAISLTRAEKVDDTTVRFVLKDEDPRFVMRLLSAKFTTGVYPIPKHVWENVDDPATFQNYDAEAGLPISTGPYSLTAALPARIVMDRRDDWWGANEDVWGEQEGAFYTDLPDVKRIITTPIGDRQQAAQLLASKEFDWIVEAPVPMIKKLLDDYSFITTLSGNEAPYGNIDWWPTSVYMNHELPELQDINVRKALLHTINPQQIIDIVFEGASELLYQPYPSYPSLQPYIEAIEEVTKAAGYQQPDPDLAAQYMTEAGYEKDDEGFWSKDGQRWSVSMDGSIALEQVTTIIVEQLRRGGFEVDWAKRPDYRQRIMTGISGLSVWGHNGSVYDPHDTMLLYHSDFSGLPVGTTTMGFHRWTNERFDELATQVGNLPPGDPEILPLVTEAFTIWADEVVEIPVSQWYHRIPFSTERWTNWPSADNPYAPPTVSAYTSALVIHGLEKAE